jgi:DNA-binding transcriptional ArsR family regulator
MVEHEAAALDRTFAALGDPTRRALLARLREGDATVGELAAPFDVSLNAVSKHLRVLERAGLVRRSVRGREHHLSLDARPLHEAAAWAETYRAFWESRLDALDDYLRERDEASREGNAARHRPPGRRRAKRRSPRRPLR